MAAVLELPETYKTFRFKAEKDHYRVKPHHLMAAARGLYGENRILPIVILSPFRYLSVTPPSLLKQETGCLESVNATRMMERFFLLKEVLEEELAPKAKKNPLLLNQWRDAHQMWVYECFGESATRNAHALVPFASRCLMLISHLQNTTQEELDDGTGLTKHMMSGAVLLGLTKLLSDWVTTTEFYLYKLAILRRTVQQKHLRTVDDVSLLMRSSSLSSVHSREVEMNKHMFSTLGDVNLVDYWFSVAKEGEEPQKKTPHHLECDVMLAYFRAARAFIEDEKNPVLRSCYDVAAPFFKVPAPQSPPPLEEVRLGPSEETPLPTPPLPPPQAEQTQDQVETGAASSLSLSPPRLVRQDHVPSLEAVFEEPTEEPESAEASVSPSVSLSATESSSHDDQTASIGSTSEAI